jgi:methylated-DNA-[protein]-cysteine S-methyltransferase
MTTWTSTTQLSDVGVERRTHNGVSVVTAPGGDAMGVHATGSTGTTAVAGGVDVAHRTVPTPLGPLLVVATDAGIERLAFPSEDQDAVLDRLLDRPGTRLIDAPGRLDGIERQLEEYFAGTRTRFDVPVDLRSVTPFRRRVLEELRLVPFGATVSYADLAVAVGSPGAVRAVGSACATNPVPVIVPCHRVLRSDGLIGGYLGGVAAKEALLRLEGVPG